MQSGFLAVGISLRRGEGQPEYNPAQSRDAAAAAAAGPEQQDGE